MPAGMKVKHIHYGVLLKLMLERPSYSQFIMKCLSFQNVPDDLSKAKFLHNAVL